MNGARPCLLLLFLGLAPAVFATAATAAETESASVEELTRRARPSIVVIQQQGRESNTAGIGTGFVVRAGSGDAPKTLIVTNLHVIGEGREFTVQTADGAKL